MGKDKKKDKRRMGMPLPPSDMARLRGMKLWIATPCYGGMLTDIYVASLLKTQSLFWQLGIEMYVYFVRNESNIPRARIECVAAFLGRGENYTHFMFIDADTGWKPEYVIKLMLADREVVGGTYRKKTDKEEYTVTFKPGAFEVVGDFAEVQRMGTGFLMIKRSVFEKMMEAYPQLKCKTHSHLLSEHEQTFLYRFFDNLVDDDGTYWGEDYGFCNRWADMGGKIFCDMSMKLQHMGSFVFEGDVRKVVQWADTPDGFKEVKE